MISDISTAINSIKEGNKETETVTPTTTESKAMKEWNEVIELSKILINKFSSDNQTTKTKASNKERNFNRKSEDKFFNLVNNYYRIVDPKDEEDKSYFSEKIPGLEKLASDGESFYVVKFNVMEMKSTEDKILEKAKYKSDMKEIYSKYLAIKYRDELKMYLLSDRMSTEIREFNKKLELSSERKAIYSRDLSSIVETLNDIKDIDGLKNKIPLKELSGAIDHLVVTPYSIEEGYAQFVTHIDNKYFHDYVSTYTAGNLKYKIKSDFDYIGKLPTEEMDVNEYDKLSLKQKKAINDVMFQSIPNLTEIKYSDENKYDVQPDTWELNKPKAIRIIKPIKK